MVDLKDFDIKNKEAVLRLLDVLQKDQLPVFGKFTPQHMVEHLAFTVSYPIGKPDLEIATREDFLPVFRKVLYSDKEIRPGYKAPFLTDDLPDLMYSSLEEAKQELSKALDLFYRHFELHPDELMVNPVFGILNRDEWFMFHNKHFYHHYKQFGLV